MYAQVREYTLTELYVCGRLIQITGTFRITYSGGWRRTTSYVFARYFFLFFLPLLRKIWFFHPINKSWTTKLTVFFFQWNINVLKRNEKGSVGVNKSLIKKIELSKIEMCSRVWYDWNEFFFGFSNKKHVNFDQFHEKLIFPELLLLLSRCGIQV